MIRSSERNRRDHWWRILDPRCSLPLRASLLAGGGAVLFTLLTAWVGGNAYRRQIETQLGFMFEILAVQISDKIDRVVAERQRELRFVGGLAPFRDGGSPLEQRALLNTLRDASPDYVWIGFADSTGRLTAATEGRNEGMPVGERSWYREGREHLFVSEPDAMEPAQLGASFSLEAQQSRIMELAVPVAGSSLELAGVIAAQLRWDWASDVQFSVIPESARRQLLGATIYGSNLEVLLDSGGSGWTAPPPAPAVPSSGRLRGAMVEAAEGGTTYLAGYTRSRGFGDYPGLDWLVVVRQPVDRAFAPAWDFQNAILRWGLGFAVLLFMSGWALGSKLARRIRAITAAAQRIRSGDILAMIPRGKDQSDVSEMSVAVGDMVETLREASRSAGEQTPAAPVQPLPARERPGGSDPRRVTW